MTARAAGLFHRRVFHCLRSESSKRYNLGQMPKDQQKMTQTAQELRSRYFKLVFEIAGRRARLRREAESAKLKQRSKETSTEDVNETG